MSNYDSMINTFMNCVCIAIPLSFVHSRHTELLLNSQDKYFMVPLHELMHLVGHILYCITRLFYIYQFQSQLTDITSNSSYTEFIKLHD